ncbi:MAG: hypothetical protein AB7S38_35185 [Vulcanimicrobiota bacterium]
MTPKQRVLELVAQMPDGSSMEDIIYRLYLEQKVLQGRDDLVAGRVVTHDEARQRLSKWLDR